MNWGKDAPHLNAVMRYSVVKDFFMWTLGRMD